MHADLRSARASLHSIFPLTEDLWIDWLDDEIVEFNRVFISVSSDYSKDSDEANLEILEHGSKILDLFESSTQDYLSLQYYYLPLFFKPAIKIWTKYVNFVKEAVFPIEDEETDDDDNDDEGKKTNQDEPKPTKISWLPVEMARDIFQNANRNTSLHFLESHKVWNVWRDFEILQLERIKKSKPNAATLAGAVNFVREIFLARLSIPHSAATFSSYSPFETANDNLSYESRLKHASSIRAKTTNEYNKRETCERKLATSGYTLHSFIEQLQLWEKKKSGIDYAQILWERCVSIHCLDESVWEKYLLFCMTRMKIESTVKNVVNRAKLFGDSEENLDEIFQRACTFITEMKSPAQFAILMKNRIGLVRRLVVEEPSASNTEKLRTAHKQGIQIFQSVFDSESIAEDFSLEQEYIHDEIHLFNDVVKARAIYDKLLLANPFSAALYIQIAAFERNHGRDLSRAAWILTQAVSKVKDDESRESVWTAIVGLARETGTVANITGNDGDEVGFYDVLAQSRAVEWAANAARIRKLGKKAHQLQQQQQQQNEQYWVWQQSQQETGEKKRMISANFVEGEPAGKKSKVFHSETVNDMDLDVNGVYNTKVVEKKVSGNVKREFFVIEDSNAGNIVRLVNVKPDTDVSFFKSLFGTKIPPVDYFLKNNEDGTTDGFIEFSKTEDAINAVLRDTIKVYGENVVIQRCIPAKKKWDDFDQIDTIMASIADEKNQDEEELRKRKIYVSNLDCTADKPLLRSVFGKYGKLKEIRLVQRNTNAFAYIEFEISRSAEKSLEMDGRTLEGFPGRKMSVAISDKSKTKKRVADPKELIVTNFTRATTKEDLEQLFGQHGAVKEVRLLLDKLGLPRGVGFVEFTEEASAKSALQLNGTILDGKILAVAPSDPNVRGGAQTGNNSGGVFSKYKEKRGYPAQISRGVGNDGRRSRIIGKDESSILRTEKTTSPAKIVAAIPLVPRKTARQTKIVALPVPSTVKTVAPSLGFPGLKGAETKNEGESSGGRKTQNDFRKMLLKK
ncbi:Splicing factor [Physocladia obscura]|uniref:Splicing factor n=1 Tax=Physocladia obscura TaxID=109957 RepID=A0AAD5TC59_9FUNG|nr:Splicing factor [Physocladia obscura]